MRSLFLKIFLWFWLAMTLSSMAVVILSVSAQIGPAGQHRRQIAEEHNQLMGQALSLYGQSALEVFVRNGGPALRDFEETLEKSTGIRIFIFDEGKNVLTNQQVSAATKDLVEKVSQSGKVESSAEDRVFMLALPLAGPANHNYIIASESANRLPRPRPWFPLPRDYGLRLATSLLIGGVICYGLAWHLTKPIRRLRQATRQLGGGDLSARVGSELGRRRDEIADLGMDFDRMAERIESLVNAQQRLVRDISHELRSPLARLNVALELARRNCNATATGPLDRIERESERLNDLVAQLLTLTLLESGIEKIERSQVDLSWLVQEIADDAGFEAKNVNRSVKVISAEEIIIIGFEEMLRRAIENVVRNAVRYTAEGTEVLITLSSRQCDIGKHALLTIRDHGPGVPEEALTQLFQPFYRVTDARDRLTGGVGVGLAITERAVHLHGGAVQAYNCPDGGLVVEIDLPLNTDLLKGKRIL